jgi:hypothetical protein
VPIEEAISKNQGNRKVASRDILSTFFHRLTGIKQNQKPLICFICVICGYRNDFVVALPGNHPKRQSLEDSMIKVYDTCFSAS